MKDPSWLRDLNPAQREAVLHMGTPLLVLAGAGSGKTRVITRKIAHLVGVCGYAPHELMAVTFTNKAAGEMHERVDGLLGSGTEVWIRTFHSTAAKLLRTLGPALGVNPRFTIIDQQDQIDLIRRIIRGFNLDTDTYQPRRYAQMVNRAKDLLLDPEEAARDEFTADPVFYDLYGRYGEIMKRENLLDFGDLLYVLTRKLRETPPVLSRLRDRFRYVLVDEFQDTNHVQYEFLKLVTLDRGGLCIVGDDDQSIYGFRGARVENVMQFTRDFRGARIIRLEENYRSVQNILTASSAVISNNPDRLGKTLYTRRGRGDRLVFCRTMDDFGEARFITREIMRLVAGGEYRFSDIAVFYRTNAQSRAFESVFSHEHIPHAVIGGFRFYEREEIKDILSYLRLLINPLDGVSLRRVANRPPRGIGRKTLQALTASTVDRGRPVYEFDADLPPDRKRRVEEFVAGLRAAAELLDTAPPADVLKQIYETTGYVDWLMQEGKEEKAGNLGELYNAVEEFHRNAPGAPLSSFVEEVSLNQGAREEEFEDDRVYLITLHNAKGLEFPVVFMAGMEEGVFPHHLSGDRLGELQEERRLCYVGMTRAKEKLYLSAARSRKLYGRSIGRDVSSFIREIPEELLDVHSRLESSSFGTRLAFTEGRDDVNVERGMRERMSDEQIAAVGAGMRVVHRQFGRGTVAAVERGVAEIDFDDGQRMKFMLKYTPITPEEESS